MRGTVTASASHMGAGGGETGALGCWGWRTECPAGAWRNLAGAAGGSFQLPERHRASGELGEPPLGSLTRRRAGSSARPHPTPLSQALRRPGIKDFCSFVAGEPNFCSLGSWGNPRSCPSATVVAGTCPGQRGARNGVTNGDNAGSDLRELPVPLVAHLEKKGAGKKGRNGACVPPGAANNAQGSSGTWGRGRHRPLHPAPLLGWFRARSKGGVKQSGLGRRWQGARGGCSPPGSGFGL